MVKISTGYIISFSSPISWLTIISISAKIENLFWWSENWTCRRDFWKPLLTIELIIIVVHYSSPCIPLCNGRWPIPIKEAITVDYTASMVSKQFLWDSVRSGMINFGDKDRTLKPLILRSTAAEQFRLPNFNHNASIKTWYDFMEFFERHCGLDLPHRPNLMRKLPSAQIDYNEIWTRLSRSELKCENFRFLC